MKFLRLNKLLVLNFFLQSVAIAQTTSLVKYANPFYGVYGGGNTHPSATLPYSLVSLGPDVESVQSPSGYGYGPGQKILGFSHARTSGTGGGGRYGNFLVMPQSGKLDIQNKATMALNEFASPAYFSCDLLNGETKVELTLSEKVGFHQYTFNETDTANILIDVSSTRLTKDRSKCTEAYVEILSNKSLKGFARYEGGWGGKNPYTAYFYAEFDQPCLEKGTWNQNNIHFEKLKEESSSNDLFLGAFFRFKPTTSNKKVRLKLAMSYTSVDQAKSYFNQVSGWNFNELKKTGEKKWESFLSRINVSGGTEDQKKLFYTSFYKTAMIPRDLTGDNPLWKSNEPHFWDFYTFWDTYRTLNPLLTIIDPQKEAEIIRCLLDIYQHKGWLPDAWTGGDYGSIQGGSNADVVLAEAIVKGLKGFDYNSAYEAMIKDVEKQSPDPMKAGRFVEVFEKYGYLPTESVNTQIKPPCGTSRTIEYSYNDYCIALAAKKLGKNEDYTKFLNRSATVYTNLFNDSLKLFWAKNHTGNWISGYNTNTNGKMVNGAWMGWSGPFYEGSPLSYSCGAHQDMARIIKLHGGKQAFIGFLDNIFDGKHYESDNEPGMHLPWMYIYAGEPHKTYERLKPILANEYKAAKNGWPGNDDAGTTSAWYMWGVMGMYPMAGQDIYLLTTPTFNSFEFNLPNSKKFSIEAKNLSKDNTYIQSATLNGKPLNKAWIRHQDIINGGKIVLNMGEKPSVWGSSNLPPSFDKVLEVAH